MSASCIELFAADLTYPPTEVAQVYQRDADHVTQRTKEAFRGAIWCLYFKYILVCFIMEKVVFHNRSRMLGRYWGRGLTLLMGDDNQKYHVVNSVISQISTYLLCSAYLFLVIWSFGQASSLSSSKNIKSNATSRNWLLQKIQTISLIRNTSLHNEISTR